MGTRTNGHRPASIKGLSRENTRWAHAKATGTPGVSGTDPTRRPRGGTGTAVQDPDGFGVCRRRCRAPNPLPAAHRWQHPGWSCCSRKEAAGPSPNLLPWGRSCPPALGAVPGGGSVHFTLRQLVKHRPGRASCPPGAGCPPGRALSHRGCSEQLHQGSEYCRTGAISPQYFPSNPKALTPPPGCTFPPQAEILGEQRRAIFLPRHLWECGGGDKALCEHHKYLSGLSFSNLPT